MALLLCPKPFLGKMAGKSASRPAVPTKEDPTPLPPALQGLPGRPPLTWRVSSQQDALIPPGDGH